MITMEHVRKRRKAKRRALKQQHWTGSVFVGQAKAGLVFNHVRERHGHMLMVMERCAFHNKTFQTQGTTMHRRSCQANTNRVMSWSR